MINQEHHIIISPDGTVRFIWDDALQPICAEGKATVRRVGDVDADASGRWVVNLSRIGGGRHGPFTFRHVALKAERAIVTGHLLAGEFQGTSI